MTGPSSSLVLSLLDRAAEEADGGRIRFDRAVLSGAAGPEVVTALLEGEAPRSPSDVVLCLDFHAPEVETRLPRARARCLEAAHALHLGQVFDLNAGVGSAAVVDYGLVRPGQIVVGSGRCLGVVGAVGALGLLLPPGDLVPALRTGAVSFPAREAVEVVLRGRLPRFSGPWDLAHAVTAALEGAHRGRLVEIGGNTRELGIGFRCALCGLLAEMGAAAALVRPDETTGAWFEERGVEVAPASPPASTSGWTARAEIAAGEVRPVVGEGYGGPVRTLVGAEADPIHGAFVGSCYGGYLDDFAAVAEILRKAGRVHPQVRLTLSPATLEVARAALHAGYYEIFLQSGAMVAVPGAAAGSAGGGAILGEGEHLASTMEYHGAFVRGGGAPRVSLLGPAAAAAAAAAGRLVDPAEFMS